MPSDPAKSVTVDASTQAPADRKTGPVVTGPVVPIRPRAPGFIDRTKNAKCQKTQRGPMDRWLVPVVASLLIAVAAMPGSSVATPESAAATLDAAGIAIDDPCDPACADIAFTLAAATDDDGWLEVRIHWDGTQTPGLAPTLTLPDGTEVAGARGFDASRIQLFEAPAGDYHLAIDGTGAITGYVRTYDLDEPRQDGADKLPNVVTLAPVEVGFSGCMIEERLEQGAERCLRLGNAIGNTGDGPLQVYLTYDEAALALATSELGLGMGQFVQRIDQRPSGSRDVVVGAADFHEVHGHWHYDGFADFRLYEVDEATGLRGAEAGTGHKSGFCFLDIGQMQEPDVRPVGGGNAEADCLVPWFEGWSMGVSVGYYDYYWTSLADQYIEASGVGSGLFELVSVADPDGWLLETDEQDNAASLLLRIDGNQVTVLEERAWYVNPDP